MHDTSFVFPNDSHPPWSIMIVLYPYISGLVVGAFVVSSLYYGFRRESFRPVARLALVASLCFCSFATLPLLLHLHHPERCFNVVITPSFTSAMAGFGFIYNAFMLLLVVETWLIFRPAIVERAVASAGPMRLAYRILALGGATVTERSLAVDRWLIRALAIAGIPLACVLTGYVGFLFGSVKANPWWSTSLMPVIFVISALLSGSAALNVLYLYICWRRKERPDRACVQTLARYIWTFLAIAVTLEGLELLQMAYEADGEWRLLSTLLTEHLDVSFGVVQVLIGSAVPLVLLATSFWKRISPWLATACSGTASLLVLVQVFAMRWNVVVGGQLFSKSFRGFVEYPLTWTGREGLIAGAVVLTLPIAALWLASKVVPFQQREGSTSEIGGSIADQA